MVRLMTTAVLATLSVSAVFADTIKCDRNSKCPSSVPCCSQYGECGVGAYCLGGCDPQSSNALDSCAPAPICQSKTYNFDNLDGFQENTKYLGDASKADWTYSGEPKSHDGTVLLTMAKGTVGTLVANNHYMWYGKTSAKLKTSRGAGVVTAFILLSDVKDEIDFEFVGTDLQTAQTNFYFQGYLDYQNGKNASAPDTFDSYHTYEIDWQPDQTTWSVDGTVVRTLTKSQTFNATTNQFDYPQTPARVQLSLWPAGLASNGEGTIAWAGGLVDWNSEDIQKVGYYYAVYDQVTMECYDPPSGANVQGKASYIYTDAAGTNNTVEISGKDTVLASFQATGNDPEKGASSSSASASSSAAQTSEANTVPGMSGGSPGANPGSGSSDSGSSASGSSSGSSSAATGFSQGTSTDKSGASAQGEKVLQGSLFAVMVALVVLVTM